MISLLWLKCYLGVFYTTNISLIYLYEYFWHVYWRKMLLKFDIRHFETFTFIFDVIFPLYFYAGLSFMYFFLNNADTTWHLVYKSVQRARARTPWRSRDAFRLSDRARTGHTGFEDRQINREVCCWVEAAGEPCVLSVLSTCLNLCPASVAAGQL